MKIHTQNLVYGKIFLKISLKYAINTSQILYNIYHNAQR
jgi:hypothetical protein